MTSVGPAAAQQARIRTSKRRRAREGARDRLLRLRDSVPHLTDEDAEFMQRTIREARESSIGDPVPA